VEGLEEEGSRQNNKFLKFPEHKQVAHVTSLKPEGSQVVEESRSQKIPEEKKGFKIGALLQKESQEWEMCVREEALSLVLRPAFQYRGLRHMGPVSRFVVSGVRVL